MYTHFNCRLRREHACVEVQYYVCHVIAVIVDVIFWNMEWLCSTYSSQFLWFIFANYAEF